MTIPIHTVGYGNRSIEDFLNLLAAYHIRYLIDIRSTPSSRYAPHYSQNALIEHLKKVEIQYLFMGDTLGGRPADQSCYVNGKVDYNRVKEKDFYQQGKYFE